MTPHLGVRGFESLPLRHLARKRWLGAALLLPLLAACAADRALRIETEPPGATVRIDDKKVGVTPLVYPFKDYGERRVTLYLEGHLSQSHVLDVKPRWYSMFPIDLITEVLIPVGWRDHRTYRFVMEPGIGVIPRPDLDSVLQRAETLRRAGPEGPKTKPPEAPGAKPPAR